MRKKQQAQESLSIDQARDILSTSGQWVTTVMERLSPLLPKRQLNVLEIGSAQGRALIALSNKGHTVFGVEPYLPAIEVAKQLAAEQNVEIDIREGRAEEIPYSSSMFDLVLAFNVMEHVENLEKSLGEISRVLKPGGTFWFCSASSMSPFQGEIKGFPFFGWYPDKLKKRIMKWAVAKRPELVGYTDHPALHWWTPLNTRKRLFSVGFDKIWDRWDLRLPSENHGIRSIFIQPVVRYRGLRFLADILILSCSYAARKSN